MNDSPVPPLAFAENALLEKTHAIHPATAYAPVFAASLQYAAARLIASGEKNTSDAALLLMQLSHEEDAEDV